MQRPNEKVNHALVLGGLQGIGKDTLLEPVKAAVGPWNFVEVSPRQLTGRFNGFVKSVILRVSEARDLGDIDRYAFYDHMKVYTAAPPDVLRVDEKNLREYVVWNVCGVIITTNHKTDGLYLPADDRRHFFAWSNATKDDFTSDYWAGLYRWYDSGGVWHVGAYLAEFDLANFDPKAPPPKTPAFWDVVDSNRAPEDAELADCLDRLMRPSVTTLAAIAEHAQVGFSDWLRDRKNARQVPHRLETAGYAPVRNPDAKDGLWRLEDRRQVVYGRLAVSARDRLVAARELARARESGRQ
ncbi:MAG: primase-helicase family protein [Vicinamibacterales bacterium]